MSKKKKRIALIAYGDIVEVRTTTGKWMTEFTNGIDAMEWAEQNGHSYVVIDLND